MAQFTIASSLNLDSPRPSYTETRRVTMPSKTQLTSAGFASVFAASSFPNTGQMLSTFSRTDLLGPMRVRRIGIQPVVGGSQEVFDVSMVADTEYQWMTPKAGTGSRQYILPVSAEFEANEREVELWRTGYTTQPSANLNGTTDIGGASTTTGGKPVLTKVKVIDVKVSMVIDTSNGPSNLVSVYDTISTAKNKWNSAVFLHWQPNNVFCTNATVTQLREEFYRVTYMYRWDAWFDCVQEPNRDATGLIYFNSNTDDPTTVYWKSESRSTFDHNNIFSDCFDSTIAKDIAKKGSFLS